MILKSALLLLTLIFSPLTLAQDWIIDVRTPEEVAEGMVDDAINIEYQNIVAGAQQKGVSKDDRIFVYCRSGRRSEKALKSLQAAGYSNVQNIGSLEQATEWRKQHASQHADHKNNHHTDQKNEAATQGH